MEGFLEIFNSVIESGGVELILTAAGLPMAAAGVGIYRKVRKAKKLKRQSLADSQNRHLPEVSQIGWRWLPKLDSNQRPND